MTARPFPDRANLTICFAHVAYRLGERFAARNTGIRAVEVRSFEDLSARIPEADVLVVSGLWRNELMERAANLKFIQSIGAGTDQFPRESLRARDIRLASAQGVNERAVAEHAMALILALMRHIPAGRDNQRRRHWRGMISDPCRREDELGGKTLLIVGLGRIGSRLATLARAFGLRVVATKRDPSTGTGTADVVVSDARLGEVLPQADIVALTCPLTPQTEKLIGEAALAAMKPSAYLVNVARGRVVDEPALIASLNAGRIAGAALDCTVEEPLPESSPLWGFDSVLITPHTAGETRRYEDNLIDVLLENLDHLWRGETELKNQII
ncbi:MAG TPA: D-2-hydroxyacid dehydrogenase [Xanthobacteraceae bacterium]|jgi:phosphoglycerate dehydrogenase-like enzyme|nr:D-2-hydroxyacid dehydrogenase [Xanthobacteraceae bacterium]